jgi:4-aminobutyrate aminotransferase-like enzyme
MEGGGDASAFQRTNLKAEALPPHSTNGERPFRKYVNPELGRALQQMGMDKTFVRGEGSWLWDTDGRRYLDFLAQYGALPFGFNPPRIWAALQSVCDNGEPSFVQPSFLNAAGELAKRLLAIAPPGMAYVTFGNSGAEAIEAAIKLCRSTTDVTTSSPRATASTARPSARCPQPTRRNTSAASVRRSPDSIT